MTGNSNYERSKDKGITCSSINSSKPKVSDLNSTTTLFEDLHTLDIMECFYHF